MQQHVLCAFWTIHSNAVSSSFLAVLSSWEKIISGPGYEETTAYSTLVSKWANAGLLSGCRQNVTNQMSVMEELASIQMDDNKTNAGCGWSIWPATWPSWVCPHSPHVFHADRLAKNLGQLFLVVANVAFQHIHAGPHQPLKGLNIQHWNRIQLPASVFDRQHFPSPQSLWAHHDLCHTVLNLFASLPVSLSHFQQVSKSWLSSHFFF